jgi:WD40 repeat protein
VLEGDVAGELSRVPALPLRYVVRDELDGLVAAVVGTAAGGAVGLTGEPADVGLHGIGGIGKSVLAAALANDDRIGRRFPDGVYWVTVGERPDVLALQLDLLSRLGARPEARTTAEATQALRSALADKRALLVVDDVWSDDAAQAFRATGQRGRLLYTSRDEAVIAAAGATARRIGVLSPDAARALAGEVLGMTAATLPPAADRAFEAVGHVPLAVALLAAAIRGRRPGEQAAAEPDGGPWEEIAADLARDADVYGTHPYATTFRALNIAVAALPADLRAALLGLSAFPPDTAIPLGAVARYWAHTRHRSVEETAADLDRLVEAHVLQRNGDTIGFHDLAHEYLLLHSDALPELNSQLLDAYRGLLDRPDHWWTLPVSEPYIWQHLATHLTGAGYRGTLLATVTNPTYQAKRIVRDGPHAGEADLAVAARLVPDDSVVSWWRAWLARHAHLLGGGLRTEPQAARISMTMFAWMQADPSRPNAVRPASLSPLLPRPCLIVRDGLRAESSALIRVLAGHDGGRAVAWSPDHRLAVTGDDGTTRIWDVITGQAVRRLTGHAGPVGAVSWSCDGIHLATASEDGTARIWDATSGQDLHTLTGHNGRIAAIAWSSNGAHLATAGKDCTVRIWDVATGHALHIFTGHTDWVRALAWSHDSTFLATASDDRTTRVWDATTGENLCILSGHTGRITAMAGSPDGGALATASTDRTARIWNAKTGRDVRTLIGHTGALRALAWSPDSVLLATADDDGIVRLWDTLTGANLHTLTGHTGSVRAVSWSPDGTFLATTDKGATRIWSPSTGTTSIDEGGAVNATAWSPDCTHLVSAGDDGIVHFWSPNTGQTLHTRAGHNGAVQAMAWSPDGTRVATGGVDHMAKLWDGRTGELLRTLPRHNDLVRDVAWAPDGVRLATASEGKGVRVRKLGSGRLDRPTARTAAILNGHTDLVCAVAWSPDSSRLATASRDRTIRLWTADTGKMLAVLIGHSAGVDAVTWSPDGTQLASISSDRTLRLWDANAEPVAVVKTGFGSEVHSVAWSLGGTHLAAADDSGLVIVWNRQLREVASLQLKPSRCLAWSAPLIAVGQPGRPAILELRDPADLDDSLS